jgi:hypothetical protein
MDKTAEMDEKLIKNGPQRRRLEAQLKIGAAREKKPTIR